MARRGFIAEWQYQTRLREREEARAVKAATREYNAAVREIEKARKTEEKAQKQYEKASQAERKRLEKEAKIAHIDAMEAEVISLNAALAMNYEEIDSILEATLEVDDFVDLAVMRTSALNTPFTRHELEVPTPQPQIITDPPRPRGLMPAKPTGLKGLFSGKKHIEKVAVAKQSLRQDLAEWQRQLDDNEHIRKNNNREYDDLEHARLNELDLCVRKHKDLCAKRVENIDKLITGLGYGTSEAVQEYVSIVLSNSAYPSVFPIDSRFPCVSTCS